MCVSQYGICFAKGAQELPYAVSKKVEAKTTWVMRFHAGQFRGFWGSSGPSQSTTLSFVSCSIAVWSCSLVCWSWWPSSNTAGFSWADSKSAAMICCRGWSDSGILAHVCSLVPGFLRPLWPNFVYFIAMLKVGRVGYSISDSNEIN